MTIAPPHRSDGRSPARGGTSFGAVALVRLTPLVGVVTVRGEIDMHTAPEFGAAVEMAESAGVSSVVIDLRATDFFDSAGVAVLCDLVERIAGTGRSVHVTGARPTVRKVLDITGLGPLLNEDSMPPLQNALPLVAL